MSQAAILPNGKSQFIDINGKPLVGGTVTFYEPGTLILKDTWQDDAQSILNTNPIVLDSRGQAIIYGYGKYRQRVKDSLGNLIWDEITNAPFSALSIYDMPIFMEDKPVDGEIYPIVNIVRQLSLPVGLAQSIITIDTAQLPTSDITITLYKNTVPIGTILISTLGAVTVTFLSAVIFLAQDQFKIVWPSPQDATAGNIAMTFVFSVVD